MSYTVAVERICDSCGRKYTYQRAHGMTLQRCNSCIVNDRRFELKRRIVAYLGGKCSECGYDKCLGALEVHHRDPAEKSFSVSGRHCLSWKKLEPELRKCVLLCMNCHREHHHNCERYQCGSIPSSL